MIDVCEETPKIESRKILYNKHKQKHKLFKSRHVIHVIPAVQIFALGGLLQNVHNRMLLNCANIYMNAFIL